MWRWGITMGAFEVGKMASSRKVPLPGVESRLVLMEKGGLKPRNVTQGEVTSCSDSNTYQVSSFYKHAICFLFYLL